MSKPICPFLTVIAFTLFLLLNGCSDPETGTSEPEALPTTYASDVLPTLEHFNLILGDGANVGQPVDFADDTFFFTTEEDDTDWVVYKAPNAGDTHGTSNNTRTELR